MKQISQLLLFFIFVLTPFGCSDDEVVTHYEATDLVVHLALPDEQTVDINTRSTTGNAISDVLVVMIRGDKLKYQSFSGLSGSSFTITEFTLKAGDAVYVFCNTGKASIDAGIDSEEKLLESLVTSNTTADLMYGKSTSIYKGGTNVIKLEHSLTKVCLYSDMSGMDIENWKICNVPTKGYMSEKAGYPDGMTLTEVIKNSTDTCTYVVPRLDNSTAASQTYILLKLKNKGWYRLDFLDSNRELDFSSNPTYLDINRNYRYRFNILSVKNDGYTQEQQAATNPGSNIIYKMEIENGSSLTNGQYTLVTSKDVITVSALTVASPFKILDLFVKVPDALKSSVTVPYTITLDNPKGGVELFVEGTSSGNTYRGNEINLLEVTEGDITKKITVCLNFTTSTPNLRNSNIEIRVGNLLKQLPINLQTANSYMHNFAEGKELNIPVEQANKDGKIRIDLDDESLNVNVEILWSDKPMDLDKMEAVYDQNLECIRIGNGGDSFVGNFVVAAKVGGEIKWSWHVWCMDDVSVRFNELTGLYELIYPQQYGNIEWMDRHLGATSTLEGDITSQGLLYQWGRKDPFPNSATLGGTEEPTIYHGTVGYTLKDSHPMYGTCIVSRNELNNIEYAIVNPTKMIQGNYYEWHIDGIEVSKTLDMDWATNTYDRSFDFLWTSVSGEKTAYDPCPIGWRVAKGGEIGPWISLKYDEAVVQDNSWRWGDIYYPRASYRNTDGSLLDNGQTVMWWGEIPLEGINYNCTTISKARGIDYAKFMLKAAAVSVRCIKCD